MQSYLNQKELKKVTVAASYAAARSRHFGTLANHLLELLKGV